jgi:hypothetical protein
MSVRIFRYSLSKKIKGSSTFSPEKQTKMGERVELESGEAYKARYERKEELGRGKFGVVFQVRDVASQALLAAKHIR